MADPSSDDYFQDSFTLDDDDLALLDEAEAKFNLTASGSSARFSTSPPPAKRYRGWLPPTTITTPEPEPEPTPLPPSGANSTNPDIVLGGIGSYCVGASQALDNGLNAPSDGVGMKTASLVPTKGKPSRLINTVSAASPAISSRTYQAPRQTAQKVHSTSNLPEHLEIKKELASLKAEFEKVNREYRAAQDALKKAEVARYARDGEVSILRKSLEKASEQHAIDLARLRELKEKADAEQIRLQKEMKEQIERLRTEFVFKQHEWESSARKSTWSSRSRRASSGPYPSPAPVPADIRAWSSGSQRGVIIRNSQSQTPRRKSNSESGNPIQLTRRSQATGDVPFPGFENSFAQSMPLRSPTRRRTEPAIPETPGKSPLKGKGKAPAGGRETSSVMFSPVKMASQVINRSPRRAESVFIVDDTIQDFDFDMDVSANRQRRSGENPGRGSSPAHDVPDTSSIMGSESHDDLEQEHMDIDETFVGIDWREELRFLLFTHSCVASKTVSFHYLLSASLDSHCDYIGQYHQACSSVLETLGSDCKYNSLEDLKNGISNGLMKMGCILWRTRLLAYLTALWDLMRSIMLYIPAFTTSALRSRVHFDDEHWSLLSLSCDISRESLQLKEMAGQNANFVEALLHSTLSLMETVAWTVPDTLSENLALFPKVDCFIMSLLDQKQYMYVISHAIRMLVVLATHLSLCHSFIVAPGLDIFERPLAPRSVESGKIPLIERLSSFLIDSTSLPRDTADHDLLAILNFFALINYANCEGRNALLRSMTLVPSLVYFLTSLSSLIWEDDIRLTQSVDLAKRTVTHIKHGLYLLHRLVFPGETNSSNSDELTTDFDLRYKLHTPPLAVFNGLPHMFTVMIGRLSYADPPEWLPADLQNDIENISELARDLLDLIIEGPEGDSVWAAYQDIENEGVAESDEIELQMFEDNSITE